MITKKLSLIFFIISSVVIAQAVDVELFKSGFSNPVDIQNAGDDRLFIVEKNGVIKILNADATINPIPFLNISSLVSSGGERGLLGLAFHPDYSNNGFFFVNYTDNSGDTQISRFSVDGSNPDIADPSSEFQIIDIDQPFTNHNGGCIAFGPDGYLYIGMGDGGSGGDPGNRAQTLSVLLGKLLRIDIDNTSGGNNYDIPPGNPFVGDPNALDEIWAYGLRNPWRFSFDSDTGDLWIGDVGQNTTEEIDHVASTEAGLNYGWRCYEGSQPFNTAGCPPMSEMTFPVAEYPLPSGCFCSITGGYVYRGSVYSDISGLYFFADAGDGRIGTVDTDENLTFHGSFGGSWVSFGEDINSELYIADIGGSIYKIVGGTLASPDINNSDLISMIPNPASDSLHISIKNNQISKIVILDLKGSIVFSEKDLAITKKTIPVNNLAKGVYLVRITSQNGNSFVKKLVIK